VQSFKAIVSTSLAVRTLSTAYSTHAALQAHVLGFDGSSRVNDLHEYDLFLHKWRLVPPLGEEPTPRHSHTALVYGTNMYIFAGYDGTYCNDLYKFDCVTKVWSSVVTHGVRPKGRYRCASIVYKDCFIIHGGHDGTVHLDDVHMFNFSTSTWTKIEVSGQIPAARDSHCAVLYEQSMIIFGGSNGSPKDDFHELNLLTFSWKPIDSIVHDPSSAPTSPNVSPARRRDGRYLPDEPIRRFCHTGVIFDDTMYLFGGYDGINRLNDLKRFRFPKEVESSIIVPPSTLQEDLKNLVNSDVISDVTFIVEGRPIRAHRVLCLRSPFFRNMLTGEYLESRASEIVIPDISYETFLLVLSYIYCDSIEGVTINNAMEVFQAADRFDLERLKLFSENAVISSITVETAATIYLAADMYRADVSSALSGYSIPQSHLCMI
jgi:leucine-zipper-like transcriptional regulator 1